MRVSALRPISTASLVACLTLGAQVVADAKEPEPTHQLTRRLKAPGAAIRNHCVESVDGACRRRALARVIARLQDAGEGEIVRILHLGDSHVAADYITGTVRASLQERFGEAGRGFVHPDQHEKYGGRRIGALSSRWKTERVVDKKGPGLPYGFSGYAIESKKFANARYRVLPGETRVRLYLYRHPKGGELAVKLGGKLLATIDTQNTVDSIVADVPFAGSDQPRVLELVAKGRGVRIFGLSFETTAGGVLYDAIGPVGGESKVYLQMERRSMVQQLREQNPALVVLNLGGNDAMKVRRRWWNLEQVREQTEALVDIVQQTLPKADCMIWSPMDSGVVRGGTFHSHPEIEEVRRVQYEVAVAKGCAFWDLYGAMGGRASMGRWSDAGLMNEDLVHPRRRAAEIIGGMFASAFHFAIDRLE